MKIGRGVSELWRVENRPLPLTWPMAYTTACTTVQAVIENCSGFWLYRYSRFGERFCDGQYSLVTVLFFVLLSVPPCPVIRKSKGRAPVPYGVGATFVGQFHTKKNYKTAIQSECTV